MSYQLAFWKYSNTPEKSHQDVYNTLMEGLIDDSTSPLPIERIRKEIDEVFSNDWEQLDPDTYERKGGNFQLYTTENFLLVDCGSMEGEEMNHFIDIGAKHGCRLYDPQTKQRYEG